MSIWVCRYLGNSMRQLYKTIFYGFFITSLVFITAGCGIMGWLKGNEEAEVPEINPDPAYEVVDPVIRSGHFIRIGVTAAGKSEVSEMPREVSAKGEILMPYIGTVKCEGMSLQELQSKLEELYSQYIHDPQASVSFIYSPDGGGLSPWGTVLVMGEVARKGPVNIPPTRDLTVMKAIQMAGGTTSVAALSRVYVTRKVSETERKRIEVNLQTIGKHGDISKDITLLPDDVVFVPESIM